MRETTADYVSRIMVEKDLSTYDVERHAHKAISQSHVGRIKNGLVPNPSTKALKALAKGLGVLEAELFAVARGQSVDGSLAHERLSYIDFAYEGLPKSKKDEADRVIEMLEREIKRIEEK